MWVLPPIIDSWITNSIFFYSAPNITPIIDCNRQVQDPMGNYDDSSKQIWLNAETQDSGLYARDDSETIMRHTVQEIVLQ